MLQLAVWIILCFGCATLVHARPAITAVIALTLFTLIPGTAGHLLTGQARGSLSLQPASWLILSAFLVQAVRGPTRLFTELARRPITYLLLITVATAATIVTRTGSAPAGSVLVIDQILVPVLMFWLINAGASERLREVLLVRTAVIVLAAAESVMALVQWLTHSVLLYHAEFVGQYWFHPEQWNRWMGTTDHPLVLSLLLCAAVPLVAGLRRAVVQVSLLVLFMLATVITQSRTGSILVPIGVVYVLLRSRNTVLLKILLTAAVGIGVYFLLNSPIINDLQNRFFDDTGSAAARSTALDFFIANWHRFVWFGDGITTSYEVARIGGLGTSLESAYLMYAVGIGILITTVYFGAQIQLVLYGFTKHPVRGALLSGLLILIIPETFSSLGVDTLAGPLVWTILALASVDDLTPPLSTSRQLIMLAPPHRRTLFGNGVVDTLKTSRAISYIKPTHHALVSSSAERGPEPPIMQD